MNFGGGRLPAVWKRFSSTTTTIVTKAIPSKTHLHVPIPDSAFPQGYSLTGLHCGVKKTGALDLSVILSTSPRPTSTAACFTRNAFKAAPVLVSQEVLQSTLGRARALVVNSGCANAVTGKQGMDDAWAMSGATDKLLSGPKPHSETLVMSTGVIGQTLPIAKILDGVRAAATTLGSTFEAWERAALGFMTTDTFPKLRARSFTIRGKEYRLAGMDKGAGMIHPNMGPPSGQLHATLLGAIFTDAAVSPRSLQNALTYAVDRSFNSISVDGEMSTNDTIVLMANGAATSANEAEIDEATDPEAFEMFKQELTMFAADLAQLVVRDGEGATKFVTVTVDGAPTYEDAHAVASRISTSALVKTALFGEDANWGRILSAAGSISLSKPIDPTRVNVSFIPVDGTPPLALLVNGEPEKVNETRASEIIQQSDLEVKVELGLGMESAQYWTCDFSYEYVRINGDYRT
ncbi:arginine biosynthesis bifunctional protein ArgJ beta chain [Epithele typhae]|uniref:arginine biosynthesis bifunctional protein ArgJ beta chain n=1 Tax=Epithele typhae TaxID=378194 RepID=UPI0020079B88|nr:arginine biosynthesis bifunctional protein ArgJ beta chain [Epithele typhae]KAH9921699.1 arginine biosynthesis bifunctional protein ArgJ beta chain [Epithele typhae]